MIIDINDVTYEFPDYNLNHIDIRKLDYEFKTENVIDILNGLLKNLDCTREFSCGRPMMTNYIMYARHIAAFIYIINQIEHLISEPLILDNEEFKKEWYIKLGELHNSNIQFEKDNPYIEKIKEKPKRKGKISKYKTKDLITGEDSFLLEDQKTKRHIVTKDSTLWDKKQKEPEVPLNLMTFKFK